MIVHRTDATGCKVLYTQALHLTNIIGIYKVV